MRLSIIIPMYNEEEHIQLLLEKLMNVTLPSFVESFEIVVIDDCSTDLSVDKVKEKVLHANIKITQQEKNMGKGAAVRRGFSEAEGDTILIQDADLELDPNDIPLLLMAMNDLDVKFVNGSRYLPGPVRPLSSYRRYLANRFFTFLTAILINVKLTDMACGYKLFKKELLDKIKLKENRFGFEAELILKVLRIRKNIVAEVPVRYFPRNAGEGKKLRIRDGFKILWTIFKYGVLRIK
ncbi:MAG: glycosyltransferase family 2 protein [Bacteroidales bacterium]|nr:glycosyltransferase family 2 protein [Bacteroidales bacterium]